MGYQTAPHGSLSLPCGLYQFMSLTEGTALLFESEWMLHPALSSQLLAMSNYNQLMNVATHKYSYNVFSFD